MSKDPAVLLYTSDFLTGTYTMSDEQVGKYIRLLCLQHQKGHLSEQDMMNICKSYDAHVFSKFIKDEQGLFFNERMEKETMKRINYSESRRKNRKGNNQESHDNHMSNISKSYVEHMENENENRNINKRNKGVKGGKVKPTEDEAFKAFWQLYPRKSAKQDAVKAWAKIDPSQHNAIMAAVKMQSQSPQWTKDNGQFIPYPATWLNRGSWEDEGTQKYNEYEPYSNYPKL